MEIQFFNQWPENVDTKIISNKFIIGNNKPPHIYLILQYKGYVLYSLVEQIYDW